MQESNTTHIIAYIESASETGQPWQPVINWKKN